jgi:DNA-binding XRE family transcriptional regulator
MSSVPTSTTKLRQIRDSLGVTQEDLVQRVPGLRLRTYIRIERNESAAQHSTALRILEAINKVLEEQGKSEITLEDLELRLW